MREIKFRVWHPASKYFGYWGFIKDGVFAGMPSSNEDGFTMEWVRNNSQMFTGLHDREGREIFEGDIVEYENGNAGYGRPRNEEISRDVIPSMTSHVEYSDNALWWIGGKVIGNIYENPDLIKP